MSGIRENLDAVARLVRADLDKLLATVRAKGFPAAVIDDLAWLYSQGSVGPVAVTAAPAKSKAASSATADVVAVPAPKTKRPYNRKPKADAAAAPVKAKRPYVRKAKPAEGAEAAPPAKRGRKPKEKTAPVETAPTLPPSAEWNAETPALLSFLADVVEEFGGEQFSSADLAKRATELNPSLNPDLVVQAVGNVASVEAVGDGVYKATAQV